MVPVTEAALARGDFIAITTNQSLQQYSIKLGDLVPELFDFKPVHSKLLLSLGLEI